MQTQTNQYKKWVKVMSMRSGQPGINSQEYGIYKFNAQSKEEQTKIANLLYNIDKIIEEENKELEDLILWKKGLLQRMFI